MQGKLNCAIVLTILIFITACGSRESSELSSPNDQISVNVVLADSGTLYYSITKNSQTVIQPSRRGIIREDQDFSRKLKLIGVTDANPVSEKYAMLHGKKRDHEYTANKKTWELENAKGERMDI